MPTLSALLNRLTTRAVMAVVDARVPRTGYRVERGLAYGPERRHCLDVYVPDRPQGPVLVFFYGGSWQSGSRSLYRAVGEAFANEGIVTVVADYGLYPEVKYPTFIEDGALAARVVRDHATTWGGDPKRLFLAGHSAGAYIAVMLGVNPVYLAAQGLAPSDLAGIVGIAGPYDILPLYDPVLIDIFGGARNMATQPIKHASPAAPPMLLVHGTADKTVGAGNSRRLAARLGRVELIEYAGVGHAGILLSLAHGRRHRTSLHADMLRFLRSRS